MFPHKKEAKIIIIEGSPGSGKTAFSLNLLQYMQKNKVETTFTTFFNSEYISDFFYRLIYSNIRGLEHVFSAMASYFHTKLEQNIFPHLNQNIHIVCERYYYSNYVYGLQSGLDKEFMDSLYQQVIEPDIIFYKKKKIEDCYESLIKRRNILFWESGLQLKYLNNISKGLEDYYRARICEEEIKTSFIDFQGKFSEACEKLLTKYNPIIVDENTNSAKIESLFEGVLKV